MRPKHGSQQGFRIMSAFRIIVPAVAAAFLLGAPALSLADPNDSMSNGAPAANMPPGPVNPTDATAAQGAAANTSATTLTASQVSPDQAQALQNGDNTLVTNGPVPDTASNRAKYGGPMSNAGKRTAPAGN
jgi:hypothetical protein